MTAPTGFVWHELYMWHQTDALAGILSPGTTVEPGLPYDGPGPKRRLKNLLDVSGLTGQLHALAPRNATFDELVAVHDREYVDRVRTLSENGGGNVGPHTNVGPDGFDIATLAVGGTIVATEAVLSGTVRNAYALVRPSGHHAEPGLGRGLCIFNNVAAAARTAQRTHGVDRVAIVDWDVHHGNGAEAIFADDPSVLTISIHQDHWVPRSGAIGMNGTGAGLGTNINVPLPPGSGAGAYTYAFEQVVAPALSRFRPGLVIVPSGFDANALDPLARMMMYSDAFRTLTRIMLDVCDELCDGRLVLSQEGGYSESYVPFVGLAVIEELSGIRTDVDDPHLAWFSGAAGQALEPHQRDRIDDAAALVANVPAG